MYILVVILYLYHNHMIHVPTLSDPPLTPDLSSQLEGPTIVPSGNGLNAFVKLQDLEAVSLCPGFTGFERKHRPAIA